MIEEVLWRKLAAGGWCKRPKWRRRMTKEDHEQRDDPTSGALKRTRDENKVTPSTGDALPR